MKFHIELSADYWDKAPQVKVDINNDVVWDGTVINIETIKYEKEILSEEEVKLNITLYNKQNDQVILKDGKVIKDQTIHIKRVEIDEIDIEDLIWEAEYTPIYDPVWYDEQVADGNSPPQVTKNTQSMGINGTWCLTFKEPFYLWLLERQIW